MAQLGQRTLASTAQEHVDDHNEIHRLHNELDDSTGSKGDVFGHNGTNWVQLPIGTDNQQLTADSSEVTGLAWKDKTFFNLRDFGAVGDGITDDEGAYLAALAAAVAVGGGTIYFPDGTYYFGSEVPAGDRITLVGGSPTTSIIKFNTVPNGFNFDDDYVTFRNLGFEGVTTQAGIRMKAGTGSHLLIDNCHFQDHTSAIYITGVNGNHDDIVVQNCRFALGRAIFITEQATNIRIVDNEFMGWDLQASIRFIGSATEQSHTRGTVISNNVWHTPDESGGPGSGGHPILTGGLGGVHRDIIVTSNYIYGNNKAFNGDTGCGDNLAFNSTDNLTISDNVVLDSGAVGISVNGGAVGAVTGASVTGNVVSGSEGAGIWMSGTYGTCTGNVCINNGQDRANLLADKNRSGIVAHDDADGLIVEGNVCVDNQGVATQQYGLVTLTGAVNVILGLNYYAGNGVAPVLDEIGAIPDITGARDDGTALASLLTTLATLGIVTDSSTAS